MDVSDQHFIMAAGKLLFTSWIGEWECYSRLWALTREVQQKNYTYANVTSERCEAVMGQRVRSIYLTFLEQSVVPALTKYLKNNSTNSVLATTLLKASWEVYS
jgi:hypothetical protein